MVRRDDWETPKKLFDYLNAAFRFDLDAAASEENALCENFYSEKDDALAQTNVSAQSIFCNPPYNKAKAFAMWISGLRGRGQIPKFAILLPVRSDRFWFQEMIHQYNTCWITGRLHFGKSGKGAFMYSIIVYSGLTFGFGLPDHVDASFFNDNGKGGAKS